MGNRNDLHQHKLCTTNQLQTRARRGPVITLSALLGPSYLLSIAMTHFWPLYLMVGTLSLGTIFGAMKFLYASDEAVSRDALAFALNAARKALPIKSEGFLST